MKRLFNLILRTLGAPELFRTLPKREQISRQRVLHSQPEYHEYKREAAANKRHDWHQHSALSGYDAKMRRVLAGTGNQTLNGLPKWFLELRGLTPKGAEA